MTMGELASIAHEINQPLTAIVNNGSACLDWLAGAGDAPNLEEAREAARDIIRDGNRAGEVITRIRALLRKTETEKARLDINQTVQEVVLLTQNEAVRKGVGLRMELAADLPPGSSDGHELAIKTQHELLHRLPFLSGVTIHVDPANASGEEHHHIIEHAHDGLPTHSHF